MSPLLDRPAIHLEEPSSGEHILVVSDLHLGIEYEIFRAGGNIPSQTSKMAGHIVELAKLVGAERVVILGDLKHGVTGLSRQEMREIPVFFETLLRNVERVDVVPGNHDSGLGPVLPRGVSLHPARGVRIGETGFFHGHTWPGEELLSCKVWVTGHNHAGIEFVDGLGYRHVEPAWIRAPVRRERFMEVYPGGGETCCEWVCCMPSFNPLVGNIGFNSVQPGELLGPIFRRGILDLENAEVYLLDGLFLGKLGDLRMLVGQRRGRGGRG
ncbi:MAG: phosphoesterase [Methanobacteriota archaeon]|nr:MAG: phosphoesterase [Euryarchaeota archaeon]